MSPRRRPADRWPYPGDNPLRRRERIAHAYREALQRVLSEVRRCPHGCVPRTLRHLDVVLDRRSIEWGQRWVITDRRRLDDHELLTTEEVADHFDVSVRTVEQWHHRDGLSRRETVDGIRYVYGEIVEFRRRQNEARAQRRAARRRR